MLAVQEVLEKMEDEVKECAVEQARVESISGGLDDGGDDSSKDGSGTAAGHRSEKPTEAAAGVDAADLQQRLHAAGVPILEAELERTKKPPVETIVDMLDLQESSLVSRLLTAAIIPVENRCCSCKRTRVPVPGSRPGSSRSRE